MQWFSVLFPFLRERCWSASASPDESSFQRGQSRGAMFSFCPSFLLVYMYVCEGCVSLCHMSFLLVCVCVWGVCLCVPLSVRCVCLCECIWEVYVSECEMCVCAHLGVCVSLSVCVASLCMCVSLCKCVCDLCADVLTCGHMWRPEVDVPPCILRGILLWT